MWTIKKINNSTHELTVKCHDGTTLDLTIPETHRNSLALKHEYIRSQTDAHDANRAAIVVSKIVDSVSEAPKSKKSSTLHAIIILEAVLIVILALLKSR